MFDSNYYKNRIVYTLEDSDYKAMVELNLRRRECYVFLPSEEKPGDYDIYLRKFDRKPLDPNRVEYLSNFLIDNGYTDMDFINPIGRTKKIVNALDKINMSKKEKTWDDLLLTEEEIKIYMQKGTIPFDSKTIFGTTDEQKEQVQSEPNGPRLIKK